MNIKGFKVNFIGDSITEGGGVKDPANNRYDNRMKTMCNLSAVNNYGISGTRLAHQICASQLPREDLCFCGRAYDIDSTADMVVVYGGVNDYLHGDAPFGKLGDTTPATFCGGVYFLMNFLREKFKDKPVIFMTPARCYLGHYVDDEKPSCFEHKHTQGQPLLDYVNAIKETGRRLGIPVLDLYHNLGIDPHNEEDYLAYTADGLHFNDAGHGILAQRLKEFIEAL